LSFGQTKPERTILARIESLLAIKAVRHQVWHRSLPDELQIAEIENSKNCRNRVSLDQQFIAKFFKLDRPVAERITRQIDLHDRCFAKVPANQRV
jgi:hypothetical protein